MAKFYTFEEWLTAHPQLEKRYHDCDCHVCTSERECGDECETLEQLKREYNGQMAYEKKLYQQAMRVAV